MTIPGILLIVLGLTVLIEPRILVWLVAVVLMLTGLALLAFSRFMGNVAARFRNGPGAF